MDFPMAQGSKTTCLPVLFPVAASNGSYKIVVNSRAMSSTFSETVPGESCFNLNFSNPGGSFGPPITFSSASAEASPASSVDSTGPSDLTSTIQSVINASASSSMEGLIKTQKNGVGGGAAGKFHSVMPQQRSSSFQQGPVALPNGKKTKGRVKIKMEFIENKLRRYTTFSKRKTGIMKKAYELSTLTGTQVMLLVASETGHVYTFATKKLQPMITSEAGKALIQTCLNTPESAGPANLDRVEMGGQENSFQTSELSPAGSKDKRKRGKPGKDDDLAPSPKSAFSTGLPTMVPSGSAFNSTSDVGPFSEDDDSDDDEESSSEHPSPSAAAGMQSESPMTSEARGSAEAAARVQAAAAQMLFPAAGQPFSLVQGPGGTVMYQMPQGVVYAAPTGLSGEGAGAGGLMFGLAPSSEDCSSGTSVPGQQFITIPVPLSLTSMVSTSSGVQMTQTHTSE